MTERTDYDETTEAVGTVYATAYDPFTALTVPPTPAP
jgi:hypothetical protein